MVGQTYNGRNDKKRGGEMKLYHHILIIAVLLALVFFLYGAGLGAIPFMLASVYLGYLSIKEFQRVKKSKRW